MRNYFRIILILINLFYPTNQRDLFFESEAYFQQNFLNKNNFNYQKINENGDFFLFSQRGEFLSVEY
jgi:hypothetical protein